MAHCPLENPMLPFMILPQGVALTASLEGEASEKSPCSVDGLSWRNCRGMQDCPPPPAGDVCKPEGPTSAA